MRRNFMPRTAPRLEGDAQWAAVTHAVWTRNAELATLGHGFRWSPRYRGSGYVIPVERFSRSGAGAVVVGARTAFDDRIGRKASAISHRTLSALRSVDGYGTPTRIEAVYYLDPGVVF